MAQRLTLLVLVALVLVACTGPATPGQSSAPASNQDGSMEAGTATPGGGPVSRTLRPVRLGVAYIPNVQFAPFYVADQKGYYADEGLAVTFDYNYETDTMQRVAQGNLEFTLGGGLSVMLARQQEFPVVTVMALTHQFPVVFFSKGSTPLTQPEDLKGKSVGIPGRFGASYYALLALLYASQMQERDLDVQEVGFNQLQLILEDKIQVAAGYAMNEPVKLRAEGEDVHVLRVDDYFPLVSDGLIANEALIEEDPELVRSFVQATLRGMRDTLDNPDEAFALSRTYIPEANLVNPEFERTVLQESLPYWQNQVLGYSNQEKWEKSHTFLQDIGLLTKPIAVEEAYTNEFVQ